MESLVQQDVLSQWDGGAEGDKAEFAEETGGHGGEGCGGAEVQLEVWVYMQAVSAKDNHPGVICKKEAEDMLPACLKEYKTMHCTN